MQVTELFRFIVLGLGLKQTWLEDSFEASRLVLPVLFVFFDTGLRLAFCKFSSFEIGLNVLTGF